jgi:branched-chain amino acid transport system substrate-binding protein
MDDDDTRAFAKHFAARPAVNGKMPSGNQASVYASTLAYLNAVVATGSDDAKIVVRQMNTFKGKDTRQLRERRDGISGQKCL